jgi:glycosyltransferase involved in cell wall biosynthesis
MAQCSVIVPCYNAAATLQATIASALAEPEAVEIIAVDDGSTDETPALLSALAAREPRLKVVSQANAGVAAARNAGIRVASSSFIAFLDSDDIWHPGHLAANLKHLEGDATLGVSFSRARFVDTAGREIGVARPKLSGIGPADILAGNPCTTTSTIVVRRATLDEIGAFDEALRRNEDQQWLLRVALSRWQIGGIDALLVDYRTSPTGLASDLDGLLADFERVLAEARRLAPEIAARHEAEARARCHRYLARRALRLGQARATARHHIRAALGHAPTLAIKEPRATLATLAATLLPANALVDRFIR